MYYYFILCIVGDNVGGYDKHKHIWHLLFFFYFILMLSIDESYNCVMKCCMSSIASIKHVFGFNHTENHDWLLMIQIIKSKCLS